MSQSLGKACIALLSATTSVGCLAVVLLFFAACSVRPLKGPQSNPDVEAVPESTHERVAASSMQPGEYITEKGWGRLQVSALGESLLFSLNTVTGEAGCTLSGEVKGGHGIVKEDSGSSTCVLSFAKRGEDLEISASSQTECKKFCGYNGGFEGAYRRAKSGCSQDEIEQTRKGFRHLYGDKDYKSAVAKLSPVLSGCVATLDWEEEGGIRNDLAIAQYKSAFHKECLETLSQYAEDAKRDDDSILEEWAPVLADRYLAIVKAARTNIALCSEKR